MAYKSIVEMATNSTLRDRIAACAAMEQEDNPVEWANANMWKLVANSLWDEKWTYARDTQNENVNPNAGARTDVIDDSMILSAVETLRQEQSGGA
jgi:hypothetical protein